MAQLPDRDLAVATCAQCSATFSADVPPGACIECGADFAAGAPHTLTWVVYRAERMGMSITLEDDHRGEH